MSGGKGQRGIEKRRQCEARPGGGSALSSLVTAMQSVDWPGWGIAANGKAKEPQGNGIAQISYETRRNCMAKSCDA